MDIYRYPATYRYDSLTYDVWESTIRKMAIFCLENLIKRQMKRSDIYLLPTSSHQKPPITTYKQHQALPKRISCVI